jgi:predicted metal-dependent phosphoesterase TrpH
MIDLHTHSTFSDGSLTPEQLVERAKNLGVTALALTDHDSTSGIPRFMTACRAAQLTGIPGVEISVEVQHGTLHMLGYFVEAGDPGLEAMLVKIRGGRELRNREILDKLNKLGLALTWEEVAAFAGEDVVGRPHFAQAMIARGYVTDKDKAFERYLSKGKPAYTDRFRLFPAESMQAIAKAGGLPVLSHPFTLELSKQALRAQVKELKALGLVGIEVYYSEHDQEQVREYLALAKEFDLVATGGSDFHGDQNPAVELGSGFGTLVVPEACLDQLRQRRAKGGAR